jgi:hypothetical protein
LIRDLCFIFHFLFICFKNITINFDSSFPIDSFLIEMYGSMSLCADIDLVHGFKKSTKALFSYVILWVSSFLCMSSPLFLVASTNLNWIWKLYFDPDIFLDAPDNQQLASAFSCIDLISMGTWWVDLSTRLALNAMLGVIPCIA